MKRVYKIEEIDSKWIRENIELPKWQRDLYPSRVNAFINHLKNGTFIQSVITVNKVNGNEKMILLGGGHRLEAIKQIKTKIKMDLRIYEDLSEEEMKQVYEVENDVKGHRIIDDIKIYIGYHDWLDALLDEKNFPINVTCGRTANSIRIDRMLNVIRNGLFIKTISRQNLSRGKLKKFLEEFDAEKFASVKEFCFLYKKCFGDPSTENWLYCRNTVMFTLMRIWLKNKDNFDEETIIKCFKEIENKVSVKQDATSVDAATLEQMTRKVYRVINKGRSINKFQEFWEEE